MSLSLLVGLLPYWIRLIKIYLQFWMRYLSQIFGDILEMFVHYFKIITYFLYVCQSISWLTFLQILGKYRDISCSWWDIFLKFLGDILGLFVHFFQIITDFLYVCQSIGWLTSIFWMRYLSENFWTHYWDVFTLFPNKCKFFVCLSVCSLTHFLTDTMLTVDISSSGGASFLKFSGDIPWMYVH